MYQVFVVSPNGERIELLATQEERFGEGAKAGAQALLNLLCDEMDLEDGYQIVVEGATEARDAPFSSLAEQVFTK